MTIIGLKTGDNGIQGLSPAHTYPHCYPVPTLLFEDNTALQPCFPPTLARLLPILCFIIARLPPQFCPHLNPKSFQTFVFLLKVLQHTCSNYILFRPSPTHSSLFIFSPWHAFPQGQISCSCQQWKWHHCHTVAEREKERERFLWNENDIWLNTETNAMSSFQENHEPVTKPMEENVMETRQWRAEGLRVDKNGGEGVSSEKKTSLKGFTITWNSPHAVCQRNVRSFRSTP